MKSHLWNEGPFIVIWEVTRSCALACQHCRASAQLKNDPRELSTEEGLRFIDMVVKAKPGVFILTGGDPMNRPDLLPLIRYAAAQGLRVAMSPSATPKFAEANLKAFADAGLERISLSIDGASRETHDRFRGVSGTWDWTMKAAELAHAAGIELQINTTFSRSNRHEFDGFVALLEQLQPKMWSVFQLVPTGRAQREDLLTGSEMERLFEKLADLAQKVDYAIKTTEGQHYRRVAWQRWKVNGGRAKPSPIGINDGRGFVFVSHIGEICPSGFLPVSAGNVRGQDLLEVYCHSPMFKNLRDSQKLKGKCGQCEYRNLCGGSRARAYALTGDYLAEESLCVYQPLPKTSLPC